MLRIWKVFFAPAHQKISSLFRWARSQYPNIFGGSRKDKDTRLERGIGEFIQSTENEIYESFILIERSGLGLSKPIEEYSISEYYHTLNKVVLKAIKQPPKQQADGRRNNRF